MLLAAMLVHVTHSFHARVSTAGGLQSHNEMNLVLIRRSVSPYLLSGTRYHSAEPQIAIERMAAAIQPIRRFRDVLIIELIDCD
jgi:hypothetical protein